MSEALPHAGWPQQRKGHQGSSNRYYANKISTHAKSISIGPTWTLATYSTITRSLFCFLYEANEDYFTDLSPKVSDAVTLTKAGIYKFLTRVRRVVVVVDCENSDPSNCMQP